MDTSTSGFLCNACTKLKVYLPTPPFIGGYSPETTKTFIIHCALDDLYMLAWLFACSMYCFIAFLKLSGENCLATSCICILFLSSAILAFLAIQSAASCSVWY